MGKYLNGYTPALSVDGGAVRPAGLGRMGRRPGNGYADFNYALNENGRSADYGSEPEDYLTDVVAAEGVAFINRVATGKKPFFLELAPFAPHSPYTPAPRHAELVPRG